MRVVKVLKDGNQYYRLNSDYDPDLVGRIKALPRKDRSYQAADRSWRIKTLSLFTLLLSYKGAKDIHFAFENDQERHRFVEKARKAAEKKQAESSQIAERVKWRDQIIQVKQQLPQLRERIDFTPYLKKGIRLFNHQAEGAIFLNHAGCGLLAMEMGTGKSLTALAGTRMKGYRRILILCPNSLKHNWAAEIDKFLGASYYIINYNKNRFRPEEAQYLIVNYEYFRSRSINEATRVTPFGLKDCQCIIADESHRLKETSTNTYKNIKKLFGHIKDKYLLSGTIMPNRATELYGQLKLVDPLLIPNKNDFFKQYCGLSFFNGRWVDVGKVNTQALHQLLQPYTFRVKKDDVLDLPEKIFTDLHLDMDRTQTETYRQIKEGVLEELFGPNGGGTANMMTITMRLRQYLAHLKVKPLGDIIERLVEEGEKVVVFDVFKEPLRELQQRLGDHSALFTGDVNIEERNKLVQEFQDKGSNLKVLLLSIKAGSVGLTLTASSHLFLNTLDYVPAENEQAIARVDRIGQKKTVNIYRMLVKETVDEDIVKILDGKNREISATIDNTEYETETNSTVFGKFLEILKGES